MGMLRIDHTVTMAGEVSDLKLRILEDNINAQFASRSQDAPQ